jgi:hypothetical protein
MGLSTRIISGLFVALQVLAAGCSQQAENANRPANAANSSNANAVANSANDSIDELRATVQVPFEPEDLTWRIVDAGQNKKRLVAVFLLSPETFRSLSAKYGGGGNTVEVNVEPWFPAELKAMGDTSEAMMVTGRAYPATEFFQPPYTAGNFILIPETNYAILDVRSE